MMLADVNPEILNNTIDLYYDPIFLCQPAISLEGILVTQFLTRLDAAANHLQRKAYQSEPQTTHNLEKTHEESPSAEEWIQQESLAETTDLSEVDQFINYVTTLPNKERLNYLNNIGKVFDQMIDRFVGNYLKALIPFQRSTYFYNNQEKINGSQEEWFDFLLEAFRRYVNSAFYYSTEKITKEACEAISVISRTEMDMTSNASTDRIKSLRTVFILFKDICDILNSLVPVDEDRWGLKPVQLM
jgi:hypothetical protein